MWQDYNVYNYGLGGTTMINSSTNPYMSSKQYSDCLTSGMTYDVILVMLGTNDSDRDKTNWTSAKDTLYLNGCKYIMKSMQNKNKDVLFVLANCPAYYNPNGYFGSAHVRELAESIVPKLNDAGFPTTFFDMYSVTAGHSEWFPDQLHPNDAGHKAMAKAWAESLQETIDAINAKK